MTITTRGHLHERKWKGTCAKCGTEAETANVDELDERSDNRPYSSPEYFAICPVCGDPNMRFYANKR